VERFTAAQQLLAGCRDLIRSTDPEQLAPIVLTRSPAKPSRDVAAELARVRAEIAKLAAEHQALDVAPLPLSRVAERRCPLREPPPVRLPRRTLHTPDGRQARIVVS